MLEREVTQDNAIQNTEENALSPEQAAMTHGRYLGLLRIYGELDLVTEELEERDFVYITTERKCPRVTGRVQITQKDPLVMDMEVRLQTGRVVVPYPIGAELPTDVPDNSTIYLSVKIYPVNVFTVLEGTKRAAFVIKPTEIQQTNWEDGQAVDADVLGRGADRFTTLNNVADFLEREYLAPQNRRLP